MYRYEDVVNELYPQYSTEGIDKELNGLYNTSDLTEFISTLKPVEFKTITRTIEYAKQHNISNYNFALNKVCKIYKNCYLAKWYTPDQLYDNVKPKLKKYLELI